MSVTTIYHTHNKHNEDSTSTTKNCSKKQTCNICEAPFAMTRGCSLEKRCPACRELGLQSPRGDNKLIFVPSKKTKKGITIHPYFTTPPPHKKNGIILNEENLYRYIYEGDGTIDGADALQEELKEYINLILKKLAGRERQVIEKRFGLNGWGDGLTYAEIGEDLKITKQRVRQIETKAIKKLKHPKVGRVLFEYLRD